MPFHINEYPTLLKLSIFNFIRIHMLNMVAGQSFSYGIGIPLSIQIGESGPKFTDSYVAVACPATNTKDLLRKVVCVSVLTSCKFWRHAESVILVS